MAYDEKKDKELFSEEIHEIPYGALVVKVMRYDNSEPKLQLTRIKPNDKGEGKFAKLGRLSRVELDLLMPVIEKAKEKM